MPACQSSARRQAARSALLAFCMGRSNFLSGRLTPRADGPWKCMHGTKGQQEIGFMKAYECVHLTAASGETIETINTENTRFYQTFPKNVFANCTREPAVGSCHWCTTWQHSSHRAAGPAAQQMGNWQCPLLWFVHSQAIILGKLWPAWHTSASASAAAAAATAADVDGKGW